MKALMLRTYFLILTILWTTVGLAQLKEVSKGPEVAVVAMATSDSILLRWGANDPVAWQLANKYGYMVQRFTIVKDGEIMDVPEKRIMNNTPIKPRPLEEWETLFDSNDYAAIALQALYGETFDLTTGFSSDIAQVVNKSRELESRFSFALFAAEQSVEVAKYSGLYLVDNQVNSGDRYLYQVFTKVPPSTLEIDTGSVYLGPDDAAPLPQPRELQAQFGDQAVILRWNSVYHKKIYSSYKIEKSEDGVHFSAVDELPFVNFTPEERKGGDPNNMYKLDSLAENLKTYYYRIRGISSFGMVGPPSDTVSGKGIPVFNVPVSITKNEIIDEQRVKLTWEVPGVKQISQIQSFEVLRANKDSGPYRKVSEAIPPSQYEFIDTMPESSNYYKIQALGKNGGKSQSLPYFVQMPDSIPPAIPTGLVGTIDTTGLVKMSWDSNQEADLLGYRIFRANFKHDEFIQITSDPLLTNEFTDTLGIDNLTKEIYYTVQAVDKRFNNSEYAIPLMLEKPDVVPPVPPVFQSVKTVGNGVELSWINSSSSDVVNHLLYRRIASESDWELIAIHNVKDSNQVFLDSVVRNQITYDYTLLAVDKSNLESKPATPVRVVYKDLKTKPAIRYIRAIPDRNAKHISLEWSYDLPQVQSYLIYKKEGELALSLYRTVEAINTSFVDRGLKLNNQYSYRMKAVFEDGSESKISEIIAVEY